jgi:hypothetical protein
MRFFNSPETLDSRLSDYRRALIRHFGGLKMRFLAGRETLSSRLHGSLWKHFCIFWRPENAVLQGSWDPRTHSYLSYTEPLFGIMAAWNCDSSRVLRNSAQGHVATDRSLIKILVDWKCISSGFMSSLAQRYIASCGSLFNFLAAWKCDSS